jgi:hypothetical protein
MPAEFALRVGLCFAQQMPQSRSALHLDLVSGAQEVAPHYIYYPVAGLRQSAGGPKNICIIYPKKEHVAFIAWAMIGIEAALADVPNRLEKIKNEGLSQLEVGCVVRIHPEGKCYIFDGIQVVEGKEYVMISPNKNLGHLYSGNQYLEIAELSPARMERVRTAIRATEYGKLKHIRTKTAREGLDLIVPSNTLTLNNRKMLVPRCLLVASRNKVSEFLSRYAFRLPFMSEPIDLKDSIGCAEAVSCGDYGASCVHTNSMAEAADFLRRVGDPSLPVVVDGIEHLTSDLKDVLYPEEGRKRPLVIISDNSERAAMSDVQYNLKYWRVHDVEINDQ